MNDFEIRFFHLHLPDFADQKFIVAKLRRVSSAPVQVGTVSNSLASTVARLADLFRLGKASRNYADLRRIDWLLGERFQTDADTEWMNYEQVVCRALGVDQLEPLGSRVSLPTHGKDSKWSVTLHDATMNDLPYLVARVGSIMGSLAPTLMTFPNEKESALARLRDVFRIGVQGQAFEDYAEQGRKVGKTEHEIRDEWRSCERAVLS